MDSERQVRIDGRSTIGEYGAALDSAPPVSAAAAAVWVQSTAVDEDPYRLCPIPIRVHDPRIAATHTYPTAEHVDRLVSQASPLLSTHLDTLHRPMSSGTTTGNVTRPSPKPAHERACPATTRTAIRVSQRSLPDNGHSRMTPNFAAVPLLRFKVAQRRRSHRYGIKYYRPAILEHFKPLLGG
jgi:hypothetical protein